MIRRPLTIEAARAWAEDLCSRAEYASGEIRERLLRKGLSVSDAQKIVDSLIDTRFIDDARFARAFVRDKVNFSRWGKKKIALALYQKRVPRDIIRESIDEIDEDTYIKGLVELLASKMRSLGIESEELDYETKSRLYRFAASRGYESSSISAALISLREK